MNKSITALEWILNNRPVSRQRMIVLGFRKWLAVCEQIDGLLRFGQVESACIVFPGAIANPVVASMMPPR